MLNYLYVNYINIKTYIKHRDNIYNIINITYMHIIYSDIKVKNV